MADVLPLPDITPLTPARADSHVIKPETEVLCINRGRETLEDMFDSVPYKIAPGYFTVAFAGARHFQGRQIVPGSRNPELKTVESFIGIIGLVRQEGDQVVVLTRVDSDAKCQPFTDEECRLLSLKTEGLDRAHMMLAITPPQAELVDVNEVRLSMVGAGAHVVGDGRRVVDPGAVEPPSVEAVRETAAEAGAAADDVVVEDVPEPPAKGRRK